MLSNQYFYNAFPAAYFYIRMVSHLGACSDVRLAHGFPWKPGEIQNRHMVCPLGEFSDVLIIHDFP